MSDAQPNVSRALRSFFGRRRVMLVTSLVAASLVITGFVWANKKVSIEADGKTVTISTIYTQPEDVLAQAKIYLGPKDEYRVSTPKIMDGTVISVYRAVPVTVVFQDKSETIITGKPTVGELAQSLGFGPAAAKTLPAKETRIAEGMEIRIIRVTERTEVRTLPVEPPVVRQPDENLDAGETVVVEDGVEGRKEVTVKVRMEDGVEAGTEVVSEKVLTEPKPQIVRAGSRDHVQTSRGMERFKRVIHMEASAYLPTDGSPQGLTASGIKARRGVVAVDPSVIPLGSRVYIPGYGLALAADTGGAIIGDKIDLCMEDYGEAMRFGRRTVKVYVISD